MVAQLYKKQNVYFVNVRQYTLEKTEGTTQRHWKHWEHKTQDKKHKTLHTTEKMRNTDSIKHRL